MKSKILSIFSILTLAFGFAACDDHNYGNEAVDQGKLSFAGFGVDVESAETEIDSRADVDVTEFVVKVINDKNVTVEQSTYGSLPEVMTLPAGDYTVKVMSHEVLKAEFDHPYYEGSRNITVKANSVTDAGTVVCRFASIRVTIRYSENLIPLLGDDVQVRVRANDSGELTFVKNETRSGYFEAVEGSTTLIAVFEGTVNGQKQLFRKELTDVMAGHHRIITFKVKGLPEPPEETGSIDPNDGITIDTSVEDVDRDGNVTIEEDVLPGNDRPGSDEEPDDKDPENPDTPTPPVDDNDVKMESELAFGSPIPTTTSASGVVNIHTDSGLVHLYLTVTSTNEEFAGIALSMFGEGLFDIANPPSQDSIDTLTGLGLDCGETIRDKQDVVFDISAFIPMLNGFAGRHEFKLTAESHAGNQLTKTLIFIAE